MSFMETGALSARLKKASPIFQPQFPRVTHIVQSPHLSPVGFLHNLVFVKPQTKGESRAPLLSHRQKQEKLLEVQQLPISQMSSTVINFRNQVNQNRLKTTTKNDRDTIASLVENREKNLKMILKSKISPKNNVINDPLMMQSSQDVIAAQSPFINNSQGGEMEQRFSPRNTMYSDFRKKTVRLKHPQKLASNSVPRQIATSGFIITEDAEVEGIVSQFSPSSRLDFENQRAQFGNNDPYIYKANQTNLRRDSMPIDSQKSQISSKTSDLLFQIRHQREQAYQQSMQKLKELELRQQNTLGFLKNSLRQTAAAATAAIIQHVNKRAKMQAIQAIEQQDQSNNNNDLVKVDKTVLISKVCTDEEQYEKIPTRQSVPTLNLFAQHHPAYPMIITPQQNSTPVRHPPQPTSQINVLQPISNMRGLKLQGHVELSSQVKMQITQKRRNFEEKVSQLQQLKASYTQNNPKSPSNGERHYHLVIPQVNTTRETIYGSSRQSCVSPTTDKNSDDTHTPLGYHQRPSRVSKLNQRHTRNSQEVVLNSDLKQHINALKAAKRNKMIITSLNSSLKSVSPDTQDQVNQSVEYQTMVSNFENARINKHY